MAELYTKRQGEYLAFIHLYTKLNKRPPAEADFEAYFRVSAPAVHQMIVSLTNRGLIQRTPGQARSIRLLVPADALPDLDGNPPRRMARASFAERYPNLAFWVTEQGRIELGYEPYTDTYARALDEGGMAWSGGHRHETIDEWLQALEEGVREFREEEGL